MAAVLCGPLAARRASGVDVETIIARIHYLRERSGRRQAIRRGTYLTELKEALALEGWRVRLVFLNRRVRLEDVVKRIRSGRWIFRQHGHFFGAKGGKDLRRLAKQAPGALVLDGYLVHRLRRPVDETRAGRKVVSQT